MKKLLYICTLLIISIMAACKKDSVNDGSDAYSLKNAYDDLAKLPYMQNGDGNDSVPICIGSEYIDVAESAYALDLNRQNTYKVGNDMFAVLDKVGLENAINGGTNRLMAGFVFAKPLQDDTSEMLIVVASGAMGSIYAAYGTTDKSTVETIQQARLSLDSYGIKLALNDSVNLININVAD